jgi:gliding motility-associated-like protein
VLSLFIPNAFTPNEDGVNDVFTIIPSDFVFEDYTLQIFNRWGRRVFITTDPSTGWNGNHGPVQAPQDVYDFKLTIRKSEEIIVERTGSITLIR